jgi:ABC-2 type transport system ATP-binding protein
METPPETAGFPVKFEGREMLHSAISLRDVSKCVPRGLFGRKRMEVLRGLEIEVKKGEVFGYIGPNGAGKTTTIGIILGLIKPTSGTVRVLDHPAGDHEARSKIGALPEQPYFYPHLSARELLDYYGKLHGIERDERTKRTESLLKLLGLSSHSSVRLSKYSRGMLQRFAIAQSLINDPELLIYDEPFSSLDPIGRKDTMKIMLDLKSRGKTIFFSTHILSDVQYIADRVGLIAGGRLIRVIDGDEFRQNSTDEMEIELTGVGAEGVGTLSRFAHEVISDNGKTVLVVRGDENLTKVIELTLMSGYRVEKVMPRLRFLEDVFSTEMEATKR